MLRYAIGAAKAIAIFFKHKNDIDVYYEDNNDEEFYKALLDRLSDKKVNIQKLIALGDKKTVIQACISDQFDDKRKRLYIVDGDLDLINNSNPTGLKYLHVHDSYCIENLIIEEDALVEILHDIYSISKDKIKKNLKFKSALKALAPHLIELFFHFAICCKLKLGIPTISGGVERFCKSVNTMRQLDLNSVQTEIERLKAQIITAKSEDEYEEEIEILRKQWAYDLPTLLKIVSGKDFILPLVIHQSKKVSKKAKMNLSKEYLRMRLVKLCPLENFIDLKQKLTA